MMTVSGCSSESRNLKPTELLEEWQTIETDDGVASIEMPSRPKRSNEKRSNTEGDFVVHKAELQFRQVKIDFDNFVVSPKGGDVTPEEYFEKVKDRLKNELINNVSYEILAEKQMEQNGFQGMRLKLDAPAFKATVIYLFFIVDDRVYCGRAVHPEWDTDNAVARRVIDSFKILKTKQKK